MTPQAVLDLIRERNVAYVDFRLVDLPGQWQHITVPAAEVGLETFRRGIPFDGSSVRGFRGIEESDMVMLPDPGTAFVDPFAQTPTLAVICDVYLPEGRRYERDPRWVAQKAEAYLRETGLADTSYWGPELEFFVFDEARFKLAQNEASYFLDSAEGVWNTGLAGGLGYQIRNKQGYAPVAPHDTLTDLRNEICAELQRAGVRIERHHHEVATAGQSEINFAAGPLVRTADAVLTYKYVVRNMARRHGKTATFMPKPIFGDNGSGMHVHQSLARDGKNLFWDEAGYGCLSQLGHYYLGGILYHAPALTALTNPTTNSYRRLVPGYEAPVNLAFSRGNRSAAVRIPISLTSPKAARIEFRTPDGTANPYLAFAAMLLAGLDGIKNRIDPVAHGFGPLDTNIYQLSGKEKEGIRSVPGSLDEAVAALEQDSAFLLQGGVFTEDLLQAWVDLKREEAASIRLRPHPAEFALCYDA